MEGRQMTLTMTLDSETEARLQAKAQQMGAGTETVAALLLADLLRAEQADPDTEMTEEEWEQVAAGIQRGEADFAEGRFRSLDSVVADKEARFGVRVHP